MGLFDKIFKKQEVSNSFEIYSPMHGEIMPLESVEDEAFASKELGEGLAIMPNGEGNKIFAPCNANETVIFETKHALSFETENGLELIIHFGLDTVSLAGEGFTALHEGEGPVKKGDELISFDLDFIKERVPSVATPVVISSMDMVESIEYASGKVKPGDLLMKVKLKR